MCIFVRSKQVFNQIFHSSVTDLNSNFFATLTHVDINLFKMLIELTKYNNPFFLVVSPEPKTEAKTLKWAISQFASVERIVGEDKYFCENCCHYTEAERSLLFDKMPEVITIHLKCFAASGLE